MDSIFIEKGTEDVTDPLRSVDKSLLPVESVEPSKEISLDGNPEADELIQGGTFLMKGNTFFLKAQGTVPKNRNAGYRCFKREKTLTDGMRRTESRDCSSDGTIWFWHVFTLSLQEAGTTGLLIFPVQ